MAKYEHTDDNRLEKPHKYMYSTYMGVSFITAYFNNRLNHLKRFQLNNKKIKNKNIDIYFCSQAKSIFESFLNSKLLFDDNNYVLKSSNLPTKSIDIEGLASFKINQNIDTESLLCSLVFSQLKDEENKTIKNWIDRLVQRFEVSKKLYVHYPSGFRLGKGVTDKVYLYWLFSLSLSLYYTKTRSIKYLSTFLKVNDLICSLDDNFLLNKIPFQGISMILQVEMLCIKLISKNTKGVDHDYS